MHNFGKIKRNGDLIKFSYDDGDKIGGDLTFTTDGQFYDYDLCGDDGEDVPDNTVSVIIERATEYVADWTDEENLCPHCAGSGEGFSDGSTCSTCKGKGEV